MLPLDLFREIPLLGLPYDFSTLRNRGCGGGYDRIEIWEDWGWGHPFLYLDNEIEGLYILPRSSGRSSTMSIGITLVGKDGIILASDSRKTFWDGRLSDNAQKIFELTPKIAVIAIGQHAGYQDWLVENYIFTQKLQQEDKRAKNLEDIVSAFGHSIREDYDYFTKRTSQFERQHPINRLTFTIAGYDSEDKPRIVNLDSGVSAYPFAPDYISSPPMCIVGVDEICNYWINKLREINFDIEKLSVKSLALLTAFIIHETAKGNGLVGGKPQIIIIKKDKEIQRIGNKAIERLQSQVDNLVDFGKLIGVLKQSEVDKVWYD